MRLFICTDKADEALLETLTDALDGYRMTIDIDRIIGERDSRPTLQASIQDCEAFVFALTRNTVHSRRCHWEFAQAVAHRRPIVVAQLDEIDPYPTALEPFLKADLRHEEGQSVLLDALYVAGATPPSILAQLLRNRLLLAIVVVVGILTAYLLAGPYSPYRETISDTVRGVIEVADRADFIYNPPQPTADPTLVAAQAPLQRMTLSANAEAILRSGQALARNGDYPAALQAFNRTLEISPGSVGAHIARGRALQAVDEIDAAEADFNAAVMLAPDLALVYTSRATFYFETERGDAAINDANRALAINPNDVGAYITRGRAYLLRGDTANAIDSHEAALALEPENSAALTYRGEAHQVAGRLKLARADYDAALILNPLYSPAFTRRGTLQAAEGSSSLALADFTRAIELDPNDPVARAGRAIILTENGEFDRATSDLTWAIGVRPTDPALYLDRGRAYRCAGSPALAVADFTRAADIDLDRTLDFVTGTDAYRCTGQPLPEIVADRVGATDPNLGGAYLYLSDALVERAQGRDLAGDLPGAVSDFTRAIQLTPTYTEAAELYHMRGRMFESRGDFTNAQRDYFFALDIVPERAVYHLDYGRMLASAGQTQDALRSIDRAIELGPLLIEAQLAKGDIYWADGDAESALDVYTRASFVDRDYVPTLTRRVRVLSFLERCEVAAGDVAVLREVAPDDIDVIAVNAIYEASCNLDEGDSAT